MPMPLFGKRNIRKDEIKADENLVEEIHIPAQQEAEPEEERTKGIETIREATVDTEAIVMEDEEDEEDEEYVYVTPNYTLQAVMMVIGSMLLGAVIVFAATSGIMKERAREIYMSQGYVQTKNAVARSEDIAMGKTAYVNGELVIGSYVEVDTSKATATANDVLKGYTCYVNGEKIVGSIPTFTAESYNGDTRDKVIPKGYYLDGTPINIAGAANLLKQNIKEGVTIFGVTGTYTGD